MLLRIRLLYYIQHEVLGDFMDMVSNPNVAATKIKLHVPTPEGFVSGWWDSEADKSLLIGVYRYGDFSADQVWFVGVQLRRI